MTPRNPRQALEELRSDVMALIADLPQQQRDILTRDFQEEGLADSTLLAASMNLSIAEVCRLRNSARCAILKGIDETDWQFIVQTLDTGYPLRDLHPEEEHAECEFYGIEPLSKEALKEITKACLKNLAAHQSTGQAEGNKAKILSGTSLPTDSDSINVLRQIEHNRPNPSVGRRLIQWTQNNKPIAAAGLLVLAILFPAISNRIFAEGDAPGNMPERNPSLEAEAAISAAREAIRAGQKYYLYGKLEMQKLELPFGWAREAQPAGQNEVIQEGLDDLIRGFDYNYDPLVPIDKLRNFLATIPEPAKTELRDAPTSDHLIMKVNRESGVVQFSTGYEPQTDRPSRAFNFKTRVNTDEHEIERNTSPPKERSYQIVAVEYDPSGLPVPSTSDVSIGMALADSNGLLVFYASNLDAASPNLCYTIDLDDNYLFWFESSTVE